MSARRKVAAIAVPQSRAEFEALAVALGETMREMGRLASEAADAVAIVKFGLKAQTAAMSLAADAQFKAVAAYAEAHRDELLPEARKSVSIAAGTIGWRMSNPAVKIDDAESVIAAIEALGLDSVFLRTEIEIDKQAILADPARAAAISGIAIEQREVLFFKPLDLDEEKIRKVATP